MTIGFFTDSYYPFLDGVATSVEACAKALEKRGHKVYVIAPRYPKHKDKDKNIYRLTSIKFLSSQARLALQLPERSLLKVLRIDFDIIHGHSGGAATLIGLQIAKARNIPYIATYHTLWNRYTHYFLKGRVVKPKMIESSSRIFGNLCTMLIAPTQRVKHELLNYGVNRPIKVVPSGINLEDFRNHPKGFLRKKTKIGMDKKILLYVGRLGKEKSVDFLIRSSKHVFDQAKDVVLVLVGAGDEKERLRKLAKELGVDKQVYFVGGVKNINIPRIYADADIFVFSSETETQGMVIVESLASGVPVVAVNDPAFENIVVSGKNGYLVKKNESSFSAKVLELLKDENKRDKFSKAAIKSAEKFSIDIMAEKLEKYYLTLLESHQRRSGIRITRKYLQTFIYKFWDQIKNYQ